MNFKVALNIFFNHIKGYENLKYEIKKIHNGFTNISFLISFENGDKFQIRIGHNNNIVDRKNEYKIIQGLKLNEYIYYDIENGNSIKKWIDGKNVTKKDIDDDFIEEFFNKLERIHNTKIDLIKHDYFAFFDIAKIHIEDKYIKLYVELTKKLVNENNYVTSHNDLNLGNLLINNKQISFIDFEWSRRNDPLFDYCNFLRETKPNKKIIEKFVRRLNISWELFNEFTYIIICFAIQWTYATTQSTKLLKYREGCLKELEKYYKLIKKNK